MAGSFGVRVLGPLEEFVEGFAAELTGLGYSWRGGEGQLRLMAHLSRWMSAQGLTPGDLTAEAVERFVIARRASYRGLRSPRALVPLLGTCGRGERFRGSLWSRRWTRLRCCWSASAAIWRVSGGWPRRQ